LPSAAQIVMVDGKENECKSAFIFTLPSSYFHGRRYINNRGLLAGGDARLKMLLEMQEIDRMKKRL